MSNPRAEVVVIGRARSGKSFLGNCLMPKPKRDDSDDDSDVEVEYRFKTSAGVESCTMEVNSELFQNCTTKGLKEKFDILYTDTPGFPDTRGAKESIEVYNTIVNYINEKKPNAIIWLLTPTREKHDRELFKTYALLMKEFANKGIYCAILANNQGFSGMNKKERAQTNKEVMDTLSHYGLKVFSDDPPYVSECHKYLKKALLAIVAKAIEVSEPKEGVSVIRTFNKLETAYTTGFKENEATESYVTSKRCEIEKKEKDISWHKKRIKDLKIAVTSTETGAVAVAATGGVLAFFTFGASAAVAGGVAGAAATSAASMRIAIADSENKVDSLQEEVDRLKSEVSNVKIESVIESHKKAMRELATIYKAMGQNEKAKVLTQEADRL